MSHHLERSKARILRSFADVIPNWDGTGRVEVLTKNALDICAKTRMVLKDFNKDDKHIEKVDKKAQSNARDYSRDVVPKLRHNA